MKYNSYINYINPLIFILLVLNISKINSTNSYTNPKIISLLNGNLFIIHKDGIDICYKDFTKIKTSLTFSENEKITIDNLSKIEISKFDNGYVICIIIDKIYIFDNEGKFLFQHKNINKGLDIDYYTLDANECCSYCFGFIGLSDLLFIFHYEYNLKKNATFLKSSNERF